MPAATSREDNSSHHLIAPLDILVCTIWRPLIGKNGNHTTQKAREVHRLGRHAIQDVFSKFSALNDDFANFPHVVGRLPSGTYPEQPLRHV